jgi:hypothetical protein
VHFQEVAFVFYNTMDLGYPQNLNPNPLGGPERPKILKAVAVDGPNVDIVHQPWRSEQAAWR